MTFEKFVTIFRMFTYKCDLCSEPVIKKTRSRYSTVFCNTTCYHKAVRLRTEATCVQCGLTFLPVGGGASRYNRKFCCMECWRLSQPQKVEKICRICCKPFLVKACIAYRYTVCSMECKRTAFPNRVGLCKTCGTEYTAAASDPRKAFCSFACYRKFSGETGLEAAMRLALNSLGIEFNQEYRIGRWSVDFAIVGRKLAIETDGDYWHAKTKRRDEIRDQRLQALGWRVVRFSETEVHNDDILDKLSRILNSTHN